MKKKFLTLISLTLLGGAIALPNFEVKGARAEGHVHSYVNGVCSCNAHLYEAEDADFGNSVNTNNEEPYVFVWENESTNPAHPMSGGKDVEYWAYAGNTLTWRFKLSEQLKNIDIRFWMATGQTSKPLSNLQIDTNGVNGKFITKTLSMDDSWEYFVAVDATLSFAEGNNEVTLTNTSMQSYNIDCLEIYFPTTTVVSAFVPGEPLGEVPIDVTPPIDITDGVVLEAETAIVEGQSSSSIIGEGMILTEDVESDNPDHATSGGGCVGNFANTGNSITWYFDASEDVESFDAILWVAPCSSGGIFDDIVSLEINGEEYYCEEFFPGYPGADKWYYWQAISLTDLSIHKGVNNICLTNISGEAFNVDCIVLGVPTTCQISAEVVDVKAPVVSAITIKTVFIHTYGEVEFEFTATDETTAPENLQINIAVYLDYKTANQEKIAVADNKFTPTDLGDYTIIVSVKDEAGNLTTKRRILAVEFEGEAPEKDVDSDADANIKVVDPRVRGGWVTFGVCLGASAALVAFMFVLSKKRV